MSEALKEKLQDREEDFKKGIKDKTQKRADQNLALRKQKRDDKLKQRRVVVKQNDASITFEQLLTRYDKKALLGGDVMQLHVLNEMLGIATKSQLDRHVNALIVVDKQPVVIHLLIRLCESDVGLIAATCLVNLTGTRTTFELECAQALVRSGYLDVVNRISQRAWNTSTPIEPGFHMCLWEVVLNIVIVCPKTAEALSSRDIVLASPLMGFAQDKPIELGKPHDSMNSGFTRDLRAVFSDGYPKSYKAVMIPQFMSVICGIYEMDDIDLPPWSFTVSVWPFVIAAFMDVQVKQYEEMDNLEKLCVSNVLAIVWMIFYGLKDDGKRSVFLFNLAKPPLMMQKLQQLFKHVTMVDQKRIIRTFVLISAFPCGRNVLQTVMQDTGCVPLMLWCTQSNQDVIREHAYLWVGNYMADGVTYVDELLNKGLLDSLIPSVRRESQRVIQRNAVYALMTMFNACDEDCRDLQTADMANGIMHRLVVKQGIFRYLAPFISLDTKDPELTTDVLVVVAHALKWNRKVALEAIENVDTPDRVTALLDQIHKLKGHQLTVLYNAAVTVDDLLNNRAPEPDRLQLMDTSMTESGMVAPGVFQGGFKQGPPTKFDF
jgi:hypothetical protein